ncbi:MAG: hypothetical protein ACRDY7_03715 [Acidimicrobiia bacterium]
MATTVAALVVSGALYGLHGHPYLARGVLGDLIGLGALGFVVTVRGRRVRHEALCCLACIGAVHLWHPHWPLAVAGVWWWSAVTVALGAYLALRHRFLLAGPSRR